MISVLFAQATAAAPNWRPAITEISEIGGVAGVLFAIGNFVVRKIAEGVGKVVDERRRSRGGESAAPFAPICRATDLSGILRESVEVQRETATNLAALTAAVQKSVTAVELQHAKIEGDLKVLLDRPRSESR